MRARERKRKGWAERKREGGRGRERWRKREGSSLLKMIKNKPEPGVAEG